MGSKLWRPREFKIAYQNYHLHCTQISKLEKIEFISKTYAAAAKNLLSSASQIYNTYKLLARARNISGDLNVRQ